MTITFKSIYGKDDNKEEVIFTSHLDKWKDKDTNVLEFLEPSNNIKNRIDYNDQKISIYAGPTTIDLELGKEIKNNFVTDHGTIIIISKLEGLVITENNIEFQYTLNDKSGNLINNFKIKLVIAE